MHRLLVCIDNSDNSVRALEYALSLAKNNGPMTLHIVTAYEEPIIYGELAVYMHEDRAKKLLHERGEAILHRALELATAAGVPFTTEILTGDISKTITDCAIAKGCDAIVLGTRGMGAVGNLLLGSVATKVIHLTTLPVILVK